MLTRHGDTLTLYRDGVQVAQRTDLPPTATATLTGAIGAQGNALPSHRAHRRGRHLHVRADRPRIDNHYTAAVNGYVALAN